MNKKHHCYLLPYFISPKTKDIQVLLAKKKTISWELGYIHNNPGQYVIPGGGCGLTRNRNNRKDKTKNASIREFSEETGMEVNAADITGSYKAKNFDVFFLRVNNKTKYNKINKKASFFSHEFAELEKVQWVPYTEAKKLIGGRANYTSYNKNDIKKYVDSWDRYYNKWKLGPQLRDFEDYINNYYNDIIRKTPKHKLKEIKDEKYDAMREIIPTLIERGAKSPKFFLDLYTEFFYTVVDKKSHTDWYETMLSKLDVKQRPLSKFAKAFKK